VSLAAAAPVLWPFAGSDFALDLTVALTVGALLAVLPVGWIFLRRAWGLSVSGPLWPLLFFEILAASYAFLTPPWQMPDEPQHMLYVELVREAGTAIPDQLALARTPQAGRDELVLAEAKTRLLASLERVDMERWLPDADQLVAQGLIPGPAEVSHPPLYYELAAALTRPLGGANILARLAVLRALGVVAMGWCVWAAGAAARMLWPRRRRLAEAPLVLAAGVPTVAAFAGAANNDVLMNLVGAAYVLLLIAAATGWVRRHPLSWSVLFMGSVTVGLLTKRTFLPLLLALPIALLALVRWNLRRVLWAGVAAQLVAGSVLLAFPADRPLFWKGLSDSDGFDRRCEGGYQSEWALCLQRSPVDGVTQVLPLVDARRLTGPNLTLGFWAQGRAARDFVVVNIGGGTAQSIAVPLPEGWHFHAVPFRTPAAQRELSVSLYGGGGDPPLLLDDVVLARGQFTAAPPEELTRNRELRWDGRVVRNELRNSTGEEAALSAPAWLPGGIQRAANGVVDSAMELLRGWTPTSQSAGILAERTGRTFSMFWATVGWAVPPSLMPLPLLLALGGLTIAGWFGAILAVRRRHQRTPWSPGLVVAAVVALVLSAAVFLRDLPPDSDLVVSGRYLFSGLVALSVVLAAGWRRLWPDDDRSFRNSVRWFAAGMHTVFLVTLFLPFLAR
jgi:hypothetical protein